MRRMLAALLACPFVLASCGEQREPAPEVFAVKQPTGVTTTRFDDAGMTIERPVNWKLRRRDAPEVFELLSGEAVVAGWAYPREEPLPDSARQLENAQKRLLDAIRDRDPGYKLLSATTRELNGSKAIDVRGEQVISKRRLRIRSVHVFEGEVEYVIEAIAPPDDYRLVDSKVLKPLLRSLKLTGRVGEG